MTQQGAERFEPFAREPEIVGGPLHQRWESEIEMEPDPSGDWVRYSDHERLLAAAEERAWAAEQVAVRRYEEVRGLEARIESCVKELERKAKEWTLEGTRSAAIGLEYAASLLQEPVEEEGKRPEPVPADEVCGILKGYGDPITWGEGEERLREALGEWHEYGGVEAAAERAYEDAGDHPRAMAAAIQAAIAEGLRQFAAPLDSCAPCSEDWPEETRERLDAIAAVLTASAIGPGDLRAEDADFLRDLVPAPPPNGKRAGASSLRARSGVALNGQERRP